MILSSFLFPFCSLPHKKKGIWFERHQEKCRNKKNIIDKLRCLDNSTFNDSVLNKINYNDLNESLFVEKVVADYSLSDDSDMLIKLKASMNIGSFHIIHLNINSIFNKFEHIFDILDKTDVDILALNEIKLDDTIPNKQFIHEN